MKYVLNIKKGTTLNHPYVRLPGSMAVPVPDNIAAQLKNYRDVVVFEEVAQVKMDEVSERVYGMNERCIELGENSIWRFQDFMSQFANQGIPKDRIIELWHIYKSKKGLKTRDELKDLVKAEKKKQTESNKKSEDKNG